jgi:2-keto-3-deoxy-L-rhamnonate aldolase RhmA
MTGTEVSGNLRRALRSGSPLFGILVKTASHQIVEALGHAGMDFVMLDQEHGPFGSNQLDISLLACRAAGIAGIVRVSQLDESLMLTALDLGAAGIMVPHIRTAGDAERAVGAARYRGGHRSFSNSTRAGKYATRGMADHIDHADDAVAVIALIEDPEGVENAAAIAGVPGLDMMVVGHADLAISMGQPGAAASPVLQAEARVVKAARDAGIPMGRLVNPDEDFRRFRDEGTRLFILGIDQTILRVACAGLLTKAQGALGSS